MASEYENLPILSDEEAKKYEELPIISGTPDIGSTVELDSSSPETTPDKSRWGRLLDLLTSQSMVPPASDESGNLIYPKSTVAGTNAAKSAAGTGLAIGGAMLAPELLGVTATPGLLGIGETALASGLGAAGGRGVSQGLGLTPQTSIPEEASNILKDTAVGAGTGVLTQAAIKPLQSLAGYLNKPARVAKMFGATPTQMDLNKPLNKNFKYLEEASPKFAKQVLGAGSLKKSYDAAKTITEETGQEIRDFYKANQNVSAPVEDVFNHENYQKWISKALSESTKPEDQATISHVIQQFDATVGGPANKGAIPLQSLWESSKDFGNELATNVANPSLAEKVYRDLRQVYVDTIQKGLEASNAPAAPRIAGLNKIFSNIFDITKNLSRKAGVAEGETFIDNATTKAPLSLKSITGNFLGLGSNRARAGLYNLNNAIQASPNISESLAVAGAQEQAQETLPEAIPFPRTAQAVEQLPEGYIKRMQTLVAHQTAESLGGVSPETVQAGQAVAAKATSDTVRVLTQGSPEDRKVLAHSQAAMIPGLFQQTPGAYPSELDSTILTSIDGEHHLNATLEGLYSGLVPSGLAFDQLQELNTKKLARVLFRPGQPIAPPQMAQPKPDVSELVDSFTSSQGASREPSY